MSQSILDSFSKRGDVAAFSVTHCIMVLSVGESATAGFSFEMSDSSDISSGARVPIEVVKMSEDSFVNLLFPFPFVPRPVQFSSERSLDESPNLTLPFRLLRNFDSLFQPIRLKLFSILDPSLSGPFQKRDIN